MCVCMALMLVAVIIYVFCLPAKLFSDPYSTVLKAKEGELLSATIATDGQWRFPEIDSVPKKFSDALVAFEDKRFYSHPGVDFISLGRALKQNLADGRVISGGSTITMQVVRLSRKGKPRTVYQKIVEIILATRVEFRYTKDEILGLYASHAPFGGNVVGLEAACWRYFQRDPSQLSWGEAALLAVLPNAPSLIYPGKNRDRLKEKRDRLLDKLVTKGTIDEVTAILAKEEPIPDEPQALPRYAPHLLTRAMKEGHAQQVVSSTLDFSLQESTEKIMHDHYEKLVANKIHNAAAIVLEVSTGKVLAYIGNTIGSDREHHDEVDVVNARRSTGSILKPFLFAAMLDEGKILPRMFLPDVPTVINGFAPKNFSMEYDGAVAANKALIRSLNIPAVHMLKSFRYEKFHSLLGHIGMTTLNRGPDHYGLSLILGGAEGTLWDIAGMYASMARTLNNYWQRPGKNRYDKNDFHSPFYLEPADVTGLGTDNNLQEGSWLSASSIFQTFDALKDLYRPGEESGWRYFSSSKRIAWKTGTSFGFRDAWAVGVTPHYVVAVWAGNADGEGRPGLTGTEAAAPIMFDIFSQLKEDTWFRAPIHEMEAITVCKLSGHRNSSWCNAIDTVWVSRRGLQTTPCPFHKGVHLTENRKFRVYSECESISEMVTTSWFVLPPIQEYYYRARNLSYKTLPPYREDCEKSSPLVTMDLIYPEPDSKIFVPRELDGTVGNVVFELAHRNPSSVVYWHLDGNFIGSTSGKHNLPINPPQGRHSLTIVDENGETINRSFWVISYM